MSAKIESIADEDVWYKHDVLGWSQQEIADYYGVTQPTIYWRLHPENNQRKEYLKEYRKIHKENMCKYTKKYRDEHKEKINLYNNTGLQGLRNKIRGRDNRDKRIKWLRRGIVGVFQIHHEWIYESDNYKFSALVDADEHRHGIINPILILEDNRIELLQDITIHT